MKEIVSLTDSRPSELFNTKKFKMVLSEDVLKTVKELFLKEQSGGGQGLQNPE